MKINNSSTGHLVEKIRISLTNALGDDSEVILTYLFGSIIRDQGKPDSDIDLAFLVEPQAYKEDPLRACAPAHLIAAQLALDFDRETDVIILNFSSIEMCYEIISTGVCIYEREPEVRLEYEAKIRGLYYDFRPFLLNLRARCLEDLE